MNPDEEILISVKRVEDGTNVSISVNGFYPNEFREALFDVITSFTNDFEKRAEERSKQEQQ